MLIIKAYVNFMDIDKILIHRTAEVSDDGDFIYELMDPKHPREVITKTRIKHKFSDGYRKLLIKVLQVLDDEEIDFEPFIKDEYK